MPTPHVLGDEELEKFLRRLPDRVFKSALRKSARKGTKVIQQDLMDAAPKGATGRLSRSIIVRTSKRGRRRGQISFDVGTNKDEAYKGRFAEYGTVHQPARPWMEPAAKQALRKAQKETARDLGRTIPKDAERLARQTGSKRRR